MGDMYSFKDTKNPCVVLNGITKVTLTASQMKQPAGTIQVAYSSEYVANTVLTTHKIS